MDARKTERPKTLNCESVFAYHNNLLYVYRETPPTQRSDIIQALAENAEAVFALQPGPGEVALLPRYENFSELMLGEILGGWLTIKSAWEVRTESAYQAEDFVRWARLTQERIQLEQHYWTVYDSLDCLLQRRAYLQNTPRRKVGVVLTDTDLYALTNELGPGVTLETLNLICTTVTLNRTNAEDVVHRFVGRVEWLLEQGGVVGDWRRLRAAFILRPLRRYQRDAENAAHGRAATEAELSRLRPTGPPRQNPAPATETGDDLAW